MSRTSRLGKGLEWARRSGAVGNARPARMIMVGHSSRDVDLRAGSYPKPNAELISACGMSPGSRTVSDTKLSLTLQRTTARAPFTGTTSNGRMAKTTKAGTPPTSARRSGSYSPSRKNCRPRRLLPCKWRTHSENGTDSKAVWWTDRLLAACAQRCWSGQEGRRCRSRWRECSHLSSLARMPSHTIF